MNTGLSPESVNVEAFLRGTLFGALPSAELTRLAGHARVERFASARCLAASGEVLSCLRLVIEGSVSVSARADDGREATLSLIGPGAWAAWLPCLVPQPLQSDYTATADTVCIALPAERVRSCLEANPALYPRVLIEIDRRVRLLMDWAGRSALLDPEQRMARLVSLLALDRAAGRPDPVLNVTQTQLATLAGCSRQSAAALLARLQARGLLRVGYGRCEIPDVDALRRFASP